MLSDVEKHRDTQRVSNFCINAKLENGFKTNY